MTAEEPGLLGNLPRSRPGTRSGKRGDSTGSKPAPKRSQAAKPGVKSAAAAKKQGPGRQEEARAEEGPRNAHVPARPRKSRPEPVAAKSVPPSPSPLQPRRRWRAPVCKVAEGVTREVLRRLPRP